MMSQPGLETIAIQILPSISQSKGKQAIKFGQLVQYNKRNIFLQQLCGKWGKENSSRPLFIFLKSLIWGLHVSIYFHSSSTCHPIKTNCVKLKTNLSRDMLNFNFSEKDLF